MILADEPTGNLDSRTGAEVLDLMTHLNEAGKTIVLVTHDEKVAARAHRVVHMKDGRIDREVARGEAGAAPGEGPGMIPYQFVITVRLGVEEPDAAQAALLADHAGHHLRRLLGHRHAGHRRGRLLRGPGGDQEARQQQHPHSQPQAARASPPAGRREPRARHAAQVRPHLRRRGAPPEHHSRRSRACCPCASSARMSAFSATEIACQVIGTLPFYNEVTGAAGGPRSVPGVLWTSCTRRTSA